MLVALACGGDDSSPLSSTPTSAPTTVPVTSTPAAPPSPIVAPSPTPVPTRVPGDTSVTGLFQEPRPVTVVTNGRLGELSLTPFKLWDGVSTVLYDAQARTETNLGPGTLGSFSPDGTKMTWVAGGISAANPEVWVIELGSGQRRSLGPGRTAEFFDNERITSFRPNSNLSELIVVATGAREPIPSAQSPQGAGRVLPDGTRIRQRFLTDYPYPRSNFQLLDRTDRVLLELEAYQVQGAGPGELLVATPPTGGTSGTSNLFIVNVASGRAEYIATTTYVAPALPFGANPGYVVWTDSFCGFGEQRGRTRIYDRTARTVTQVDASLWPTMTPGGLIASGEFGARSLFDPKTLQNVLALPGREPTATSGGDDVSWSSTYRYASRGQSGGHGGHCG